MRHRLTSASEAFKADYEVVYKVALVGDSGVGKSALLLQFLDKRFLAAEASTFGVDMVKYLSL
jgi:GTPase SAR1 family protein